ncbi:hypothetical protein pdam_00002186, partial [Pocillopora damicornis]
LWWFRLLKDTVNSSSDRDTYYYTRRWNRNSRSVDAHDQKTQQQESRTTADRRGSKSLSDQQGSKCTNQSC